MEEKTLKAKHREEIKKNKVKKLRNEGFVPAVIYGDKKEVSLVAVKENEYIKSIHTDFGKNTILNLEVDNNGKASTERVLTYDSQRNPITERYEHLDFIRVNDDTPVKLNLPVKLKGVAPGTKRGGFLVVKMKEVQVKVLPTKIPSEIEVDLSELDVDEFVTVSDVKSDDFEILSPEGNTIVRVAPLRAVQKVETDESAEAAEGEAEGDAEAGEATAEAATEEAAAE